MFSTTRDAKQRAKARRRCYRKAHERLARDRRQAQHAAEALQQALDALGLPADLVTEIAGRLRSQQQLLGKIVGMMCPPLFGCRTTTELCRVRGWDKNLPARLLGTLPKRSWIKRLRCLGLEVLVPLWRHTASKSEATRSRWQWTWVGDDSVFKKYGEQLGLVGTWWSGQEHRVLSGIDGVLLVVVIGDGRLVVPVELLSAKMTRWLISALSMGRPGKAVARSSRKCLAIAVPTVLRLTASTALRSGLKAVASPTSSTIFLALQMSGPDG